jgi:hypothetical protein
MRTGGLAVLIALIETGVILLIFAVIVLRRRGEKSKRTRAGSLFAEDERREVSQRVRR